MQVFWIALLTLVGSMASSASESNGARTPLVDFGPMFVMAVLLLVASVAIRILSFVLKRKKGAFGEKIVSHWLRKGLPRDYIILDDVYLPLADATTTQIDHIVICRYGIFAVETKNFSGWIFASADSSEWTQTIYRKKSRFQNPMRQNYRHICAIADNLAIDRAYVKGVVAFTGDCEFKTAMPPGVVYSRTAADYILSFAEQIIRQEQVSEIADAIRAWSATLSREQVANHVENLRRTHAPRPR